MIRGCLVPLAMLLLPFSSSAQVRILTDTMPPHSALSIFGGARLMKSGVASQFDSLGSMPMGYVGDSVTVYLFPDGDHMERALHARITSRQRFAPPPAWRTACDEIAHPGWFYNLAPVSKALFAVIVPGVHPFPERKPLPPAARDGAWQFFKRVADSSWQKYRDFLHPATDRALDYARHDFWGSADDARYGLIKMVGVNGTGGRTYAAFSFAMRDDYPGYVPNTAGTWVVDAWGYPVAKINSNVDIYGTVDDGGVDAIVTSSGLIRWNGERWVFPPVYSEEPCLFHEVMDPPGKTGSW